MSTGVALGSTVSVGIGVSIGTDVAVAVGVLLGTAVAVGTTVGVGIGVGVSVGLGVLVTLMGAAAGWPAASGLSSGAATRAETGEAIMARTIASTARRALAFMGMLLLRFFPGRENISRSLVTAYQFEDNHCNSYSFLERETVDTELWGKSETLYIMSHQVMQKGDK